MASIKEEAKAFIPKQTGNISELASVSVDLALLDGEGVDNEGVSFKYKYTIVDGKEYRVPAVVIGGVKDLIEANANLKTFKVKKSGEGLKTRYTVIPLS